VINSSDLPAASGDPTASEPIVAHSNLRRHRPGRRRRSGDRRSPSRRHANHRATHDRPRQRRRSAPTRPLRAKPRQLHQARVYVTWSSPQVRRCRAISETAAPTPPKTCEAFGRLKSMPEKLNETGTLVSERVHLREILVIPGLDCLPAIRGILPDRLPSPDGADISAATRIQRASRMKSWRLNVPFRLSSPTRPRVI
jgi:hypothetical protein